MIFYTVFSICTVPKNSVLRGDSLFENSKPIAIKPEVSLRAAASGESPSKTPTAFLTGFKRSFPFVGKLRAARREFPVFIAVGSFVRTKQSGYKDSCPKATPYLERRST